ncbi:MAG: hypothetical protein HYZ75_19515 [Elusimicrobia bacterium]|nr:hypothetical protein [Elusimicrobiota bacterium]
MTKAKTAAVLLAWLALQPFAGCRFSAPEAGSETDEAAAPADPLPAPDPDTPEPEPPAAPPEQAAQEPALRHAASPASRASLSGSAPRPAGGGEPGFPPVSGAEVPPLEGTRLHREREAAPDTRTKAERSVARVAAWDQKLMVYLSGRGIPVQSVSFTPDGDPARALRVTLREGAGPRTVSETYAVLKTATPETPQLARYAWHVGAEGQPVAYADRAPERRNPVKNPRKQLEKLADRQIAVYAPASESPFPGALTTWKEPASKALERLDAGWKLLRGPKSTFFMLAPGLP